MSEKLSSPPLFYAFTQIIFGPIMKIEDFIFEIQENMKDLGFPDFSEEQLPNIVFDPQNNLPVKTEIRKRWSFADIPKHNGYLLSQDMLIFHTTDYVTFDDFVENTIQGIELLHKILTFSFIQRVGMRYIDIITPKQGELVGAYVNDGVKGFIKEDDEGLQSVSSESIKTAGEGMLAVRTLLKPKSPPYIMPGELLPLNLLPARKSSGESATRFILDEDFFMAKRFAFDIDILREKLERAHEEIEKSFRSVVTEHAFKVWR
jgi:uncharacterized protein (TIGR04255 family)